MRIVIPVSAHDSHLLDTQLKLLRHFGRLENHSISFSPAQSQMAAVEKAANDISDLCGNIDILPIVFEGDGQWPQSPNLHWTLTMEALVLRGNREPIFWMELDCTPSEERWADKLEDAWRRGRKPIMGKEVPTPFRNAGGALVYEPDDFMIMGCAVYAHNLFAHPQQHIYTGGFRTGTCAEPFDIFLRGWLRQLGWVASDLIGDRWNTKDYQLAEDVRLTCQPGPTKFKGRDHSQTDITGAVCVHGCKDESLAKLILEHGSLSTLTGMQGNGDARQRALEAPQTRRNGIWSEVVPGSGSNPSRAQSAPTVPQMPFPATPLPVIDLSELKKAIAEVRQIGQEMTAARELLQVIIDELRAQQQPPQPDALPELPEGMTALNALDLPRLRGILNSYDGKMVSFNTLAKELGVEKELLQNLASQPDSGIRVAKGYLGLAA